MFKELNLSEGVLKALEGQGFVAPTGIQEKCIPLIMEGKDIVGRSMTGSGKTFAFGLPAIEMVDNSLNSTQILVMCPTRELALQVSDEFRKVTQNLQGLKVLPIYGGADISRQIKALKNSKIVVGTPGRLMDHIRRRTIKLDKIKMVVLDEADEMLNMGFRDDIEDILKHVPKARQTVMFSATMPPAIKAITKEYMVNPEYVEIGLDNSTIDDIEQSFVGVNRDGKKSAVIELFRRLNPQRAIIFCNTKRMVDDIHRLLGEKGFESLALHGDMRQSERKRVMTAIKAHKVSILIATDVAARGIDIDDVEYIINYDLPNDVEYYIHRIGRTARAGKSGKALTIINNKEQLNKLAEYKRVTKSNISEHDMSESLEEYRDISKDRLIKTSGSGGRGRSGGYGSRSTNSRSRNQRSSSDNRNNMRNTDKPFKGKGNNKPKNKFRPKKSTSIENK